MDQAVGNGEHQYDQIEQGRQEGGRSGRVRGRNRSINPATTASAPNTKPANNSHAEKFCHITLPLYQKAISVASASVKQTKGNGTKSDCIG